MYNVELAAMLATELQRIGLNKLEWVARLRFVIHADNLGKPRTVIAHRCAPGSAE